MARKPRIRTSPCCGKELTPREERQPPDANEPIKWVCECGKTYVILPNRPPMEIRTISGKKINALYLSGNKGWIGMEYEGDQAPFNNRDYWSTIWKYQVLEILKNCWFEAIKPKTRWQIRKVGGMEKMPDIICDEEL